jgi:PAS domain S-box-containing protein
MSVYGEEFRKPKRKSEQREMNYRSIFENAIEGFYQSTPEGKFQVVNPAMARILGYESPEDLLANIQDIDHQYYVSSERRKEFKRLLGLQGCIQNFESEVFRKDGSQIWISTNARVVCDEKEKCQFYEGFVTDITEHKRSEVSLIEGERFLANIFASIQDGISVLDSDLRILRVNQTMESWYAHALPLPGKKCFEAYHGAQEPCEICPNLEALKTGKATHGTVPQIGVGGEIARWLDVYSFPLRDSITGKTRGVIEYARDISDRK